MAVLELLAREDQALLVGSIAGKAEGALPLPAGGYGGGSAATPKGGRTGTAGIADRRAKRVVSWADPAAHLDLPVPCALVGNR